MSSRTSPYPSSLQASHCTSTSGNSPVIPCALAINHQGILIPSSLASLKTQGVSLMPNSDFSEHNAFLLSALMTKTICACAFCWRHSRLLVGESRHGQEAPMCLEFHIENVTGNLARGSALPQKTYNAVSRGSGERNQTQQQWRHTMAEKEDKNTRRWHIPEGNDRGRLL